MRFKKEVKFAKEQLLIQLKIIQILGLYPFPDPSNIKPNQMSGFILYEFDENPELRAPILDLIPEIKEFFCHVNITGLLYPDRCKRPWLSICRGVLKNMGNLKYIVYRHRTQPNISQKSILTLKYYLELNDPTFSLTKSTLQAEIEHLASQIPSKSKSTLSITLKNECFPFMIDDDEDSPPKSAPISITRSKHSSISGSCRSASFTNASPLSNIISPRITTT